MVCRKLRGSGCFRATQGSLGQPWPGKHLRRACLSDSLSDPLTAPLLNILLRSHILQALVPSGNLLQAVLSTCSTHAVLLM